MTEGGSGEGAAPAASHAPAPHQALWNCNLSTQPHTPTPRAPHVLERLEVLGEVSVSDPQQVNDGVRKYTTFQVAGKYLLAGSTASADFCVRRRYSDFEWLRSTLRTLFPGVVFLPLPRKQQVGRFEAAFLEERAAGLEEFAKHVFRRPGVFRQGSALIAFLTCPEASLDKVRQEFGAPSQTLGDLYREYSEAFGSELQQLRSQGQESGPGNETENGRQLERTRIGGSVTDEPAFAETKTALDLYVRHLEDAQRWAGGLSEAHRKVALATAEVHTRLSALRDDDRRLCEAGAEARNGLISAFGQHGAVSSAVPCCHFEQLVAALVREQRQAEAVLEALDAISCLQRRLQEARRRVSEDEFGQARLLRRSPGPPPSVQPPESPASRTSQRERKRDRVYDAWDKLRGRDASRQLEELCEQLAKDRQEVSQGEQWLAAARTLFAGREIRTFFAEKREAQVRSQQQLLEAIARTSQRLAEVWSGAASECAAATPGSGSPAR